MKKYVFLLCLYFFIGFGSSAYSQSDEFIKGYIVNKNNEKIEGYILDKGGAELGNNVQFKTSKASKIQEYAPDELLKFFFEPSFYFESHEITLNGIAEQKFLRKFVEGATVLYQYPSTNGEIYIIVNDLGEKIQVEKKDKIVGDDVISDNKYIGTLKSFMRDCNEFFAIKKINYNVRSLSELIMKYNECTNSGMPSQYLGQKRKLKIRPGIMAGARFINLDISNLQEPKRAYEQNLTTIQFGAFVSLYYFRKLSLQIGAYYNRFKSDTEIEFTLGTLEVGHNVSMIEIPFSLRYNFTGKKFSPYLILGFQSGFFLNGESSFIVALAFPFRWSIIWKEA